MNSALWNLTAMQLRQYVREPQVLFWSFGFPLLLVWLLGVSFSDAGVKERVVGVVLPADNIAVQESLRTWAQRLESQERTLSRVENASEIKRTHLVKVKYRFKYYPSREDVVRGLKRGEVQVFVEQDAASAKRVYHLDPQNDDAMLTYLLLGDEAEGLRQAADRNMAVLDSPGLRYIDFLVPGLVALAIMETCLIAVGWTLIEKRVTKVARQMRTTPMRKHDFFAAHVLACFVFTFSEIIVIFAFAKAYFDVQAQGGLAPFLLLTVCGNICFAGIAILAASRALKAQTATGMLEITILFLALFSGVFFSYQSFPHWLVSFIQLLPLTLLVDSMRMVFTEGAGVADVAWHAGILSAIGIGTFLLGLKAFRWY